MASETAKQLLTYLNMCPDDGKRLEFIDAYLSRERSAGKVDAVEHMQANFEAAMSAQRQ